MIRWPPHIRHETIQGNVLRGYRRLGHAGYVFASVNNPQAARELLAKLIPDVTTDDRNRPRPEKTMNIAFTYEGLKKLDATEPFKDPEGHPNPYQAFIDGMAKRAVTELGDTEGNGPDHWEQELVSGAHVLFTMYGPDPDRRNEEVQKLLARLAAGGMEKHFVQNADVIGVRQREHFGFVDGFSQPSILNSRAPVDGEGVLGRWGCWRRVRVGEFVLGYEDEDGVYPGLNEMLCDGTFMVWRKLRQHVDVFEAWAKERARELYEDDPFAGEERLKEWVVGRRRDGSSLMLEPRAGTQDPSNAFTYGRDRSGAICPVGAHVRRANPRDSLRFRTERTRRSRIIRRGMPYGKVEDDDKGLIFVCFNASISRQFELIQGQWLRDGDAFGLGTDPDLLTAAHAQAKLTVGGDGDERPRFLRAPVQPLVTVRGGYYLFVPGIRALKLIASSG